MFEWPIQSTEADSNTLRLGPPKLRSHVVPYAMDRSRHGDTWAASARAVGAHQPFAGGWVFHKDQPDSPWRLDKGKDLNDVAVSPDGDWVATGPHPTGVVKIYDARTGKLEKQLGNAASDFPRFSSDGRWLSISGPDGGLYAIKTWAPGLRFDGRAQFSSDSRLLAVSNRRGAIRLLDIERGIELARLEDPNQQADHYHVFSPDNTRLVTAAHGKQGGVHVWNLRALRRGLKELGLDWDAPDYPPEQAKVGPPLRLEIIH
jgi:WD40 repeat protein